jgi:hypothetical protein
MDSFKIQSHAYGLNYENTRDYNNQALFDFSSTNMAKDASLEQEVGRLNLIQEKVGKDKKIVLVNTSGGGLRSAMWTFHVLQVADSLMNGQVFDHTALVTGASGGMIGSAYYRELFLRNKLLEEDKLVGFDKTENISKDILNPLAFAWVVNDFFFRYRKIEISQKKYFKDRGYYFEEQLLENTEQVLDIPISYYDIPVKKGLVPEIILAPTITNDGRKLLISSINTEFLQFKSPEFSSRAAHIDFRSFFNDQESDSLRYSTALRMNATFPYVLPSVSLPSEPRIEVMDAGVRDNFGFNLSIQYLFNLKGYLDTGISKIALIRIIDNPDEIKVRNESNSSLFESFSTPVGSVYQNLFNFQRLNQEELFSVLDDSVKAKIEIFSFTLKTKNENEIPLNWHLSARDKNQIKNAIHEKVNESEMKRLILFMSNK